jgi:hypothetical protein
MGSDNGNGKWTIAFWVLAVITTLFMASIVTALVTNDRVRATEDQRIEKVVADNKDEFKNCFMEIKERLARIETKVDSLK